MLKRATASVDVRFRDERERELYETAMLGEEVRQFLMNDPVGIYLHQRAKFEIKQAEIDALEVDPDGLRGWLFGRRKLRQIRNRAAVARMLINFLGDAMVEGQNAERELADDR